MSELAAIRESGVAFDREEHTHGICAGGIAVTDAFGSLAALSVPMPAQRFNGREAEVADELLATRNGALAALAPATSSSVRGAADGRRWCARS